VCGGLEPGAGSHAYSRGCFLGKAGGKISAGSPFQHRSLHLAHMERTYKFLALFPVHIYSCRVGACKPNPLIYKQALQACKVRAQEAVYVDDISAYAQAAERL